MDIGANLKAFKPPTVQSKQVRPASLRIAIATSGRFHVLDLARELVSFGHDVRFYSALPSRRVESFGLAARYHHSLLPFAAPFAAWQRFAPRRLPEWQNWAFSRVLDLALTKVLEPCDIFICMSGIFVRAVRHAQLKYGAQIWLERGSRHILSQAEILASVPGARGPNRDIVAREMEGYRLADRIVVPSRHVAESFQRDPAAAAKLFVNPYGTDLKMFPYRERSPAQDGPLKLVFAGAWSRRKGCDVMEAAVRRCEQVHLLHVGSLADQPFPGGDFRFSHMNAVPQSELVSIYHASDVFVHASREEGMSVVLAQALASGLPIICTDRTGGEDLAHTPSLRDRIFVVPHDDADALYRAIEALRKRLRDGPRLAALRADDLATLSWSVYARSYEALLLRSMRARLGA